MKVRYKASAGRFVARTRGAFEPARIPLPFAPKRTDGVWAEPGAVTATRPSPLRPPVIDASGAGMIQ